LLIRRFIADVSRLRRSVALELVHLSQDRDRLTAQGAVERPVVRLGELPDPEVELGVTDLSVLRLLASLQRSEPLRRHARSLELAATDQRRSHRQCDGRDDDNDQKKKQKVQRPTI
jgi:hypothetical protein